MKNEKIANNDHAAITKALTASMAAFKDADMKVEKEEFGFSEDDVQKTINDMKKEKEIIEIGKLRAILFELGRTEGTRWAKTASDEEKLLVAKIDDDHTYREFPGNLLDSEKHRFDYFDRLIKRYGGLGNGIYSYIEGFTRQVNLDCLRG